MKRSIKERSSGIRQTARPTRARKSRAIAACTIISRNYLAYARALAQSFEEHHPGTPFYLFVVDRLPADAKLDENVRVIKPEDLRLPYFFELCFKYDVTEMCTAVKPSVLAAVLGRFGESAVAYFDPDILITRPLGELQQALRDAPIVLTPHLLEPIPLDGCKPTEEDILRDGAYNLGFIAVKTGSESKRFLRWWEERLRNGCRIDRSAGLFTDQKWIDLVPTLFSSHAVLRDDTYNVAYWNLHGRTLTKRRRQFFVNGRPLAFFHFSGFNPCSPEVLSKHQNRIAPTNETALARLLEQYQQLLYEKGYAETSGWGYGYDNFENGIAVHPILRRLYLSLSEVQRSRFGDPFRVTGKASFLDWATIPSRRTGAISPFLKELYDSRPDLAAAYPDPAGTDRERFLSWASSRGSWEMGYDSRLALNEAVPALSGVSAGSGLSAELIEAHTRPRLRSSVNGRSQINYRRMTASIKRLVAQLPSDAIVLCVSKGDDGLLPSSTHKARHFPQAADGSYAGYYPADSSQAIAHLESARRKGAGYLLLPESSFWWLDYYVDFREHLYANYEVTLHEEGTCTVFDLASAFRGPGHLAPQRKSRISRDLAFGVNVAGYLSSEKGLGEGVRSDIRSLEAAGIPYSLNDFVDVGSANIESFYDGALTGQHYPINLIHINADQVRHFLKAHGEEFFHDRYNIGYWAWELSHFPEDWHDSFRYFDEIWTPSAFTLDAVSRVSPIPVVRIPHSLPECLPKAEKGRSDFALPEDAFIFMFAFDFHSFIERKNPLALIHAFKRAFSPKDNVTLVLKGSHPREGQVRVLQEAAEGADVRFIGTLLTRDDTNAFLSLCDCYVSLHRSEGFGLTMAEAMSLGKPVIATAYSGNLDFMTPSNSFPLRYRLTRIEKNHGPYRQGNEWADPDVDHAAELMRHVYEHRDIALQIGEAAREDIRKHFSSIAVGAMMKDRLSVCFNRPTKAPSARNSDAPCTIAREHASGSARYRDQVAAIQELIGFVLPAEATLLVVSRGDDDLLALGTRRAWHFPQLDDGRYAGYYPANSEQAIDHLESLRAKGAQYLLLPFTAYWWLEHYPDLRAHLDARYQRIWGDGRCMIYCLSSSQTDLRRTLLTDVTDRLNALASRIDQTAAVSHNANL